MKLARPDVFHPRIVLAGSPGDDGGLVPALRRRGLHAQWSAWTDPDTLRADLVILRVVNHDRPAEFSAWTRRVRHLLNPASVVAWNSDQRYLRDLRHAGVPTVATAPKDTTALVFLGGVQSHAFTAERAADVDFECWDVGHAALRVAADRAGVGADELLCARADVTGDARLAALDVIAPALGWRLLDDDARERALRQFAVCVESALQRLGLGPLSHRRP
jgi:hypothetical protein